MTRLTIALTAFLALILSVGVFRITYQVDALEKNLNQLNKEISQENETIHILKAEWSYLNDPQRLSELAHKYLGLEEMEGRQLINMDKFERKIAPVPAEKPAAQPAGWEQ